MAKLTALKIRAAKPQKTTSGKLKATRLSDGEGLQMLVAATGGKS
jgi:hypothetical protein